MVLNPFSLSRERRTRRLSPESNTSCAMRHFRAVLDANSELDGKEGVANPVANLGQGHSTNEAIPGVAYAKRATAAVLLGNEDGSGPELYLREGA